MAGGFLRRPSDSINRSSSRLTRGVSSGRLRNQGQKHAPHAKPKSETRISGVFQSPIAQRARPTGSAQALRLPGSPSKLPPALSHVPSRASNPPSSAITTETFRLGPRQEETNDHQECHDQKHISRQDNHEKRAGREN